MGLEAGPHCTPWPASGLLESPLPASWLPAGSWVVNVKKRRTQRWCWVGGRVPSGSRVASLIRAHVEEVLRGSSDREVVYSKTDPWSPKDFLDPEKEWIMVQFQTLQWPLPQTFWVRNSNPELLKPSHTETSCVPSCLAVTSLPI